MSDSKKQAKQKIGQHVCGDGNEHAHILTCHPGNEDEAMTWRSNLEDTKEMAALVFFTKLKEARCEPIELDVGNQHSAQLWQNMVATMENGRRGAPPTVLRAKRTSNTSCQNSTASAKRRCSLPRRRQGLRPGDCDNHTNELEPRPRAFLSVSLTQLSGGCCFFDNVQKRCILLHFILFF